MTTGTPRITFFLSHSMKDQAVVELVRQQIVGLGVDLYLAEHDPQPGRPLADKVIERIHRSDAMVVLPTEAAAGAPFVQQEIGVARGRGIPIIPIVQKGIDGNMLAMLAGVERIEVDFADLTHALATVTSGLEPMVKSQLAAAAARAARQATAPQANQDMSGALLVGLGVLVLALLIVMSKS
jgi:TIR domain